MHQADADAGMDHDSDVEHTGDVDDAIDAEPHYRDWRWVEEWRVDGDRPAWGPGITLAIFMVLLVGVALLVIAAGIAPALWLSRGLPVLRFLAAGAACGMVGGWICILLALPHWS